MKKFLSSSLLLFALLGGARAQTTCTTTISTYPYYQDFESGAGGWTSGGTASTWALGTPTSAIINSASSGTKAWVTNLAGKHATNEQSFVESPCFNTTSLTAPVIEMRVWWDIEFSWDGAVLQSSVDNGVTWQNVGAFGDPDNWYTDNTLDAGPGGQTGTSAEGWSGTPGASGSNGWVTARHALTGLGNKTNLKLRIAFGSDAAVEEDGFAFDDIRIYETPVNDAAVVAITSPLASVAPGVSTPITVTLRNYGSSPLTSATMGFSVNGTTILNNYAFTGNVAPNATATNVTIGNHTFTAGPNIIKAWSRLPNGLADGVNRNDTTTFLVYSCNALTGTFTIDKNNLPSPTNFQSITEAVQALKNCGVSGPVTFNVAANSGPYNSNVVFTAINGASATNTITFNGNGNTIISGNPGTVLGVVTLDGADYIKLDNFVITLDPTAITGWGVQLMNGADHNTISNSTINLPLNETSSNINGIVASSASTSTAGNHANYTKIQNNTINGGYYGIRINGNTGGQDAVSNEITGNTIQDFYTYGIYLDDTNGTLVEGNNVSRPNRGTVSSFYGTYLTGVNNNTVISKNRYHNAFGGSPGSTSAAYVLYFSSSDSPVGSEKIVKNNLIYDINTNGTIYALYNIGSDGSHYLHNTIVLDNPNSTGTVRGMYQTTSASNLKFINNILRIDGGASGTKTGLYFGTTASTIQSNNNVLYATGGADVGYYSGAKATLADWQTANSGAYDQASVSADPMFVNLATGDLKPTNSSVNNMGQPLPAVTTDFMGATRSTTTPDAGAFEFTPAANDAGITAIISPTTPVTPNTSQPVQVTLKNYGMSPLTSATITWTVNGTAQTSYNWTGNLANNQTANVTIGNYSFPNGSYAVNVCATNPNGQTDGNPGNDCFSTPIISCTALAGTYTIDKNNPTAGTNFQTIADAAARVSNCGVSGPVTFNVVAGTGPYNEQMILTAINGTSATNTVTFNGNGNTISATPTGGNMGIVTLDGADYVTIDNFVLTLDANATLGVGVQLMNSANNNIISDNTINLPLTSTSSNISGIVAGTGISIAGNNTSNTVIQNNTITGGYYSIKLNGDTGNQDALNNQITGNTLRDFYGYGIYLDDTEGTLVQNNDVSRPTRATITSFYGVYMTGTNTNTIISKNRFHNAFGGDPTPTGAAYVLYFSSTDAPVGSENIVKNNLIYNINTNGTIYAIYNIGSDGAHYFHNTIDLTNANSTGTVRGVYQTTSASNIKFQNNIITIGASMSGTKTGLYFNTAASSITSNNNVLYVPVGDVGYSGGAHTTLAQWQTVNSGAYDQASVSADPVYSDYANGNLKPTVVSVNNIGAPVAVTDDITGAPRSTSTPDPGAYEFTVNPNDVGITAISGPVSGCGLTNAETITVTVKNFGSLPQSNVPVNFLLNGTVIGTGTVQGPIAPNATDSFTFTTTADLSAAGIYSIEANTLLTGDSDNTNNSTTISVTNALMAGIPTLNFETAATSINAMRLVTNPKSNIAESTAASLPLNGAPATSTKGMLMDGTTSTGWLMPVGLTDPWTNNPDHFAGAYLCFSPANVPAGAPLWLAFDLKQSFKTANANTNFRVTINGVQVGDTYRPPFAGGPATWEKIYVDLTSYKNQSTIQIGLESSVSEPYANGAGPANLIDNIRVVAFDPTGISDNVLQSTINVYPNPSNGVFSVNVPTAKAYTLEVTDLTGRVIRKESIKGSNLAQLDLSGNAKGVYMLKITSEGAAAIQKLIIE